MAAFRMHALVRLNFSWLNRMLYELFISLSWFISELSHLMIFLFQKFLGRVGKTSILLRYAENSFLEGRTPTLQASYVDKHVVIEENDEIRHSSDLRAPSSRPKHSKREAQLSIWDTAGQERYHSLAPIYYRNANGAILVYDITDNSSFERVQRWVKELRKMVGGRNSICLIIVGNKADLSRHRMVDAEEAKSYANSVHAKFIEVSAKTGSSVEDIFVKLKRLVSNFSYYFGFSSVV